MDSEKQETRSAEFNIIRSYQSVRNRVYVIWNGATYGLENSGNR